MIPLLKRYRGALIGISLLCLVSCAYGLDPNRDLSQYVREQWNIKSKFSGGNVNAIGQTNDGYLWIGTDNGLFRFDGFHFEQIVLSSLLGSGKPSILGLLTDASGNLWVRVQGSDILRRENGTFEVVAYGAGPLTSQVTAFSKDQNGAVSISDVVKGTFRFQGENRLLIAGPNILPGASPVISIADTLDGIIWLGTLGGGLFHLSKNQPIAIDSGFPERKINCLLAIGREDLWIGTDNGLYHWNGKDFNRQPLPATLANAQVLSLLHDHDANVWVGTDRGLIRMNAKGISFSEEKELRGKGAINALFEDREGNIWVGGARGFGRIRDTVFTTYSSSTDPRLEHTGPIYIDPKGRTWLAPSEGGLYVLENNHIRAATTAIPAKDVVYSIEGRGHDIWVGRQSGGLTHLQERNGRITSITYTEKDGLAQNSVYSVLESRDGAVWAGTLSGGVSRFQQGRFTTYTMANGLAANTISSILEARDGTMWFATPGGLTAFFQNRWKTYTTRDGLPSASISFLFEDSSGVLWSGTSGGLAFFTSGSFNLLSGPDVLREPIFGIAEDRNGFFWIATLNHVLQIARNKLLRGKIEPEDIREYGTADGLPSSEGVNRSRSIINDAGGKIWLALKGGLAVVDPSHMPSSWPPAIPHIEGLMADGTGISLVNSIHVPSGRKRITFTYTALSLAIPERIRYRYFLDGFDRQWSEPSAAREAVYTNLGPGTYRFRLQASNSYGEWNGQESDISFEVEPASWQTWWFRSICVLFIAGIGLVLYRIHLRRLTQELNMRFQERLAERTRIAQELHDTLLQGFISASIQLHVADDQLPVDSAAKPLVTRVLELMGQVIEEGRNAVRGLRSINDASYDLGQAFSRLPHELGNHAEVEFRVIIEGTPKILHPIIRDEVYRIGRESLANAFRHSHASKIEVEIDYAATDLHVIVRDDGCGIDPLVLQAGRDGHWGLPGMRERAEKIGAKLKVWSRTSAGTEIELSVPGHLAFQSSIPGQTPRWLARICPQAILYKIGSLKTNTRK